jgi:hypothetical protein
MHDNVAVERLSNMEFKEPFTFKGDDSVVPNAFPPYIVGRFVPNHSLVKLD